MAKVRGYRDLECWRRAMDLAERGQELVASFPSFALYRLGDQLDRALTSVPSNIAEGHAQSTRAFYHKLRIAQGELAEAQTQIELAMRRRYIAQEDGEQLLDDATIVAKQISALMGALGRRLREAGSRAIPEWEEDEA